MEIHYSKQASKFLKKQGAVTIMSNSDAENVWNFIVKQHSPSWDDIEEVEPDAIDIQMLKEIEADPECLEFEKDGDIVWK